jgi:signal transduction histidine kinase
MGSEFRTKDGEGESYANNILGLAHRAAHDLRSPLNTVTNIAQLFARRYIGKDDPQADQLLCMLQDAAREMHRLLHSLIVYADAIGAETAVQPTDAEEAFTASISLLQKRIEDSGASVSHDALPKVSVGAKALARIFENVIDNAISYRSPGVTPEVRVSAMKENGSWRFAVSDNGPEIPREYHEAIFEPFKKLDPAGISGSGLGLAIVKALVERHGGRLWVESEPGEGSVFYFTLPQAD